MPANTVVNGATLECTVGTKPCTLKVTSQNYVKIAGQKVATIMDFSTENIPSLSFGPCKLQPAGADFLPCTPLPAGPWAPGAAAQTIGGYAVLTINAKLVCGHGGEVSITNAGQDVEQTD